MVRPLFFTLLVVSLLPFSASAFDVTAVRDSVGVQHKNGKLFVQHKVEPKETLYALSRKYGVSVAQIVDANPSVQKSISIGQTVLIPRKTPVTNAVASAAKTTPAVKTPAAAAPATPATSATATTASNRTYTVNSKGEKIHVVEPSQTLFSISRIHKVSVDNIKRWNNLADNNISVGSELIVGKGLAATASKKPIYVPEPDDEIAVPAKPTETAAPVTPAPSGPVATTTPTAPAPTPAKPEPVAVPDERVEKDEVENATGIKKIVESGMAEMIDPKTDTNKYLALHKSAPVGTIMQVKNSMNGQVVYVRVIGKLPETGANDKVVVRLSKKAYQKLGAVDQKFRVELSYMP
ncbi:LysM peptidoglycan-binding domain-containing protein [Pontibacter ruber]|uniref:LysM peptidoglycan-binding domain-containing protein n=1 Tax=Pontibacter ruber TaxID=1343895 RepID=A0ABW5CSD9_9BACT|nr:LysM peptidoglycan-binding domain-containing protein [Pontibacter ruber]